MKLFNQLHRKNSINIVLVLLLLTIINSCKKEDSETIPTYSLSKSEQDFVIYGDGDTVIFTSFTEDPYSYYPKYMPGYYPTDTFLVSVVSQMGEYKDPSSQKVLYKAPATYVKLKLLSKSRVFIEQGFQVINYFKTKDKFYIRIYLENRYSTSIYPFKEGVSEKDTTARGMEFKKVYIGNQDESDSFVSNNKFLYSKEKGLVFFDYGSDAYYLNRINKKK